MSILVENVTKRYRQQIVVNNVSLEVTDGELFVLLGASGSGKSTILRMIAGLTPCDEGRIVLNGREVTRLPPQARGTGFVFQNYSIFRHMTLAQNIEFGLRIRRVPAAERTRRCEELLELVGLAGLGERYADQISGGQQQRVALARALAYEPTVLLLDEPLGALDAKIRVQLRRSLKDIQRRLRVTTVLVTHDQEEAYELADRIGVIERGVLMEVGAPEVLYARPKTLFVAGFLGSGTVLAGRVRHQRARLGPMALPIPPDAERDEGASVEVLFRPEQVSLSAKEPKAGDLVLGRGVIIEQTFSGALRRLRLRLPRLAGTRQVAPPGSFGESGLLVEAQVPAEMPLDASEYWVSVRGWTILQPAQTRLLALDAGLGSPGPLRLARWIAERLHAHIVLMGFTHDAMFQDLPAQLLRRARQAGLESVDLQIAAGDLVQHITAQRAHGLFELAVAPPNAEGHPDSLGPEIVSLLENGELPVIVTRSEVRSITRVLICTRAGEPGKHDIYYGGRLARRFGARVSLLHVTPEESAPSSLVRRHLTAAAATLTALDLPNEILLRTNNNAAEGILSESGEQDLVVIGGHGPRASVFPRDNITMQVLDRARGAVLVVPVSQ